MKVMYAMSMQIYVVQLVFYYLLVDGVLSVPLISHFLFTVGSGCMVFWMPGFGIIDLASALRWVA